jgi:DNA end-binding protein Ku
MKEAKKAALARIVLNGRERLVTIQARDKGFVMTTLRAGKEVREEEDAFEDLNAKVTPDMVSMAKQIIAQKKTRFAPKQFEDRYEQALLELVRSKVAGGEPVIAKAPERGNVINLMDALRRSIEDERRPPAPSLSKAEAAKPERAAPTAKKSPAKKAAPTKKKA